MAENKFHDIIEKLRDCRNEMEKREKLIELGFEFFEETGPDMDILEEQTAEPRNDRQHQLISFFNSEQTPSLSLLREFLAEKESEDINYPLIRRYFRSSNKQLKKLLLYGLENNPIDRDLLNDIAFFNEFHLNLSELITWYMNACKKIYDLHLFEEIVKDFYEATASHGYNAIHALLCDEDIPADKKKIVKKIKIFLENQSNTVRF